VTQLVEALRYKPEGSRFDSHWGSLGFLIDLSLRSHYGPGIDPASNRNDGVKASGAQGRQTYHLNVPNVYKFWESQPPGALRDCTGKGPFFYILSKRKDEECYSSLTEDISWALR
jgi:hypothetical protein